MENLPGPAHDVKVGATEGVELPTFGSSDRTPTPAAHDATRVLERGTVVGRYVVLQKIGTGGMGVVYAAYDPELDRKVALKLLLPGVGGDQGRTRLLREARALGKLAHPNVVGIHDVGTVDQQVWLAMEFVQGQTLSTWLRVPRGWREVLGVMRSAGDGLAAAHAAGLLHRDFKPDNVMVGDDGRVRVMDFGLARTPPNAALLSRDEVQTVPALDALAIPVTQAGTIVGTPSYMAPEQFGAAKLTAAADQFAFCVTLWEALYGERPFGGSTIMEMIANVLGGRRRPPSKGRGAPGRLRRVCERGLSPDPRQRWPSMDALLTELERLDAPRTRRWLVLGVAGGLTAFGVGLSQYAEKRFLCDGARDQLQGVWDEETKQEVEDAILGTNLPHAADTWDRVEQRLDEYAAAWVGKHAEVCEATSVRQEQSAAVMDLRMRCLRQHHVALRDAVGVLAQTEPQRVTQAVTLVASLPALSRCDDVEALQAELPPPEDPQLAAQVEALRDGLTLVRALRNVAAYGQALAEAEAIVARADGLGYAPLQAEALLERGLARQEQAQYEEAERDLERAYVLAAQLEHSAIEATAVRELAFVVGHDQAKHEAGLQWGKTALARARRPRADPREQAVALMAIGVILLRKGELQEALAHQQQALAIFVEALGPDHPDIADLLHNMGNVLMRQGKHDDALTHLRRARTIREQALGSRHPYVAHSLTAIGAVLIQQGEWEPALSHLRQALAIQEDALGPRHPDVATSLNNIGAVLKQQGRRPQALDHFRRALDIQQEVLGERHPRVAYPLNNIGEVLREQGKYDEALTYLQRALAISEEALGPRHPDVASSAANLGNLLLRQERYDESEAQYRRALQIQQEALPVDHPHVGLSLLGLAKVGLAKQAELAAAREHAEQAVSIREQAKMAPELLAEARFVLARILWHDPAERARSRGLAEQARVAWSSADSNDQLTKEYLAEVEQWLAEHPEP